MSLLASLVPGGVLVLFVVVAHRWLISAGCASPVRRSVIWGTAWWSVAAVGGSEMLSLAGMLTGGGLLAWWCAVGFVLAGMLVRYAAPTDHVTAHKPRLAAMDWLLVTTVALVLAVLLVVAWCAPPTIFDTLTYHLPRQVIWLQQGSLAHFDTPNTRQLMMPPFAEIAQLQFLAITGDDRLVNLVSWTAVALSAVGASLIAQGLGGDRRTQLLAAVFVVLVPMAIMQAPSAKNDTVLALWIIAFVDIVLSLRRSMIPPAMSAIMLGLTAGLALLTKGTAPFFLAPFALMAAVRFPGRALRSMTWLALALLIAIALNAGHFARNVDRFGNLSGPLTREAGGYRLLNETHAPAAVASNVVRNIAINLGTPIGAANTALSSVIADWHRFAAMDPNDPRTTFSRVPFDGVVWRPAHEGAVGAPVHVLTLLAAPIMIAIAWRRRDMRDAMVFYAAVVAAFFIFSFVFRWQFTQSRLLLPLIVAACPLVALIWGSWPWRAAMILPVAALVGLAVPTFRDGPRPLGGPASVLVVPRETQLLRSWSPEAQATIVAAVEAMVATGVDEVVLATDGNSPDYVLMRMLTDRMKRAPRFTYATPDRDDSRIAGPRAVVRTAPVRTDVGTEIHDDGSRVFQVPRYTLEVRPEPSH